MSYYPGCDDNDDRNESPEQLALDAAYTKRQNAANELDALALEQRATGRNIVQGVYYADQDRADRKRGEITERCMNDIDRLDATIARLSLADDDEFPEDVGGYDPDAVIDAEWHAREADEMRQGDFLT